MASFILWLLLPLVFIVVGAVLSIGIYSAIDFLRGYKFKRKIPKDKKELGKFIEENKEILKADYKSGKEVLEDDEEFERFREYEKLRRQYPEGATGRDDRKRSGYPSSPGRTEIPDERIRNDEDSTSSGDAGAGDFTAKRKVRLDY